jgi:hypothetical protein
MVFVPPSQIDSLWAQIARATHSRTLGIAAKVSPQNDADSHVICVYTQDYTDSGNVYKVHGGLWRLGLKWEIWYKLDIYMYRDIYRKNASS